MKPVVVILILAFFVASCKKQESVRIRPAAGNYFPLTPSSNWSYVPGNSNTAMVIYGEVLAPTRTINGKTYSVLNYQPGNTRFANLLDSSLFRKEGGIYYQAITNQQLPFPIDEPGIYEFVFMRDNAPVGTSWTTKISGTYTFSNGKLRMEQEYDGKISEFLPSFQLDDKHIFSDVVRVTMNMGAQGYGPNNELLIQTSSVYDKWYARNQGLIKTVDYSPGGFALKLDTLAVH
jgi:hypothetical protein